MKPRPWLQFFRLPNLPTAPGDALAGAAFFLDSVGGIASAVAAGWAVLCLYLFGLADNDIVGCATDAADRPLVRGDISMRAARVARLLCLLGACAPVALLPPAHCVMFVPAGLLLVVAILAYNRTKGKWLMGLCRGLGVVCGAFSQMEPGCLGDARGMGMLFLMASGWALYIVAVTWLSEGEERDSEGLGRGRYAWGLSAFAPLAACVFLSDPSGALLPMIGSLFAFLAWCAAVAPLGAPHTSADRRRAVGRTIGALLYLQIGYMLVVPCRESLVLAIVIWLAARIVRRMAPDISGS